MRPDLLFVLWVERLRACSHLCLLSFSSFVWLLSKWDMIIGVCVEILDVFSCTQWHASRHFAQNTSRTSRGHRGSSECDSDYRRWRPLLVMVL